MSQQPPPPPSAQQPPQYAQRPWSPQQGLNSPHPGDYPPSKRPRLSPNPHSPYGSPGLANISLPNQLFSRPFQGPHQNGYPSNTSNYHNTLNQAPPPPPPTHAMGTMGPPSRPSDKPTDMNELTDVLLGAGVDLREEDAALVRRSNAQHHDTSFNSHLTSSFNPVGSGSPPNLSLPPKIDYNHYSNNFPGEKSSFYGSGTFNQPAVPYQSPEERAKKEREQAERRKAETRQYHLNNPFLYTGPLQRRVEKQAKMNHLHTNLPGHYKPSAGNQPTQVAVSGPDKHERIEVLTGQHLITYDSPWVEILTLLSLAAGQRIRGFVEDAAALAKTRKTGSQGIVPPDLQGLAVGDGKVETVPALPTSSNSAVSLKTNPLKRSYAEMNTPPTPVSNGQQSPVTTIAFPNKIVEVLQKSALAQRAAEEERLTKRRRRAAAAAASGDSSTAGSVAPDPSAIGAGQRAPEPDPKKTGSKKEQRKKDEAKATEAQQHAATNKTMNMAFGLSGAMGGKKLSWMTGGASGGSSSFSRPNATSANTKTPLKTTGLSGSSLPAGRKWGEFREDKETGAGVQLRDLVSVLEDDGKEKRALARAYARMNGRRF